MADMVWDTVSPLTRWIAVIGVGLLVAGTGCGGDGNEEATPQPEPTATVAIQAQATVTVTVATVETVVPDDPDPLPTMPPVLPALEFPTATVEYPADWPEQLVYPERFDLLIANRSLLPDGVSEGWFTQHRVDGEPTDVAGDLTAQFEMSGWVVDAFDLDANAVLLTLSHNDDVGSGSVTIDRDPDNLERSLVLSTIRLDE